MKRRSFFQKLAVAAGIVALAPSLCFRTRLLVGGAVRILNNVTEFEDWYDGSVMKAKIVCLSPEELTQLFSQAHAIPDSVFAPEYVDFRNLSVSKP